MKVKAAQMHDVLLERKVMSALIYNAVHMKKSNRQNRVARNFMRKTLKKVAFKRMVTGCKLLKQENQNRAKLLNSLLKWANDVTKKTMFKVFREVT